MLKNKAFGVADHALIDVYQRGQALYFYAIFDKKIRQGARVGNVLPEILRLLMGFIKKLLEKDNSHVFVWSLVCWFSWYVFSELVQFKILGSQCVLLIFIANMSE